MLQNLASLEIFQFLKEIKGPCVDCYFIIITLC